MADVEQLTEAPVTDYDDQSLFLRPARGELLRIGLLGAALGLFIPLLGFMLEHFFISPVFCTAGNALNLCTNSGTAGYYVASVLLGGLAIVILANWQVFRPLVIAVGSIAALWGLRRYMQDVIGSNGLEYYAISIILYAASLLLFYWTMRVRQFIVSLVLAVALVVIIRWALLA